MIQIINLFFYYFLCIFSIVGYGMIFCNNEESFKIFHREDLDGSKEIYENTLFLPIHDDFNVKEALKVAQILNLYVKQIKNNEI